MLNLVLKEVKNGSIDWICLESTIIVQRKFDINKMPKSKAQSKAIMCDFEYIPIGPKIIEERNAFYFEKHICRFETGAF